MLIYAEIHNFSRFLLFFALSAYRKKLINGARFFIAYSCFLGVSKHAVRYLATNILSNIC